MAMVTKSQELVITMRKNLGAGAALFGKLKEARINVIASSCHQHEDTVHFSIVPDDLLRAKQVLLEANINPGCNDVLLVEIPNRPGAFAELLTRISRLGVNVRSAYATTSVLDSALAVIITDQDDRVLQELKTITWP